MRINRLFEIIYILIDKKNTTAKALAKTFEVSERTIYRDIDILSYAGVPVYCQQGKNGGIYIDENYVLNKTVLTKEEQNQILFSLQSLASTTKPDNKILHNKLSSLFNKQNRQWMEVDFSDWGNSIAEKDKFELIKNSIINYNELSITYFNTHSEYSVRKIYPIKLIFKARFWYLQAFCLLKNDYRLFKLGRIIEVSNTGNTFENQILSTPKETFKRKFESIHLELKFPLSMGYRIYDEFDLENITKTEDSFKVTVDYPIGEWIKSYIMSFGSNVEVIQPITLKEEILAEIEKIKKIYKNKI